MSTRSYYGRSVTPLVEHRTFAFATLGNVYSACFTRGMNGARLGPWKTVTATNRRVKTAAAGGAVTTVTAMDTAANVFAPLAVGDSLKFIGPNGREQRSVLVTKTSDDSIEVSPAVELDITSAQTDGIYSDTGYEFQYRTLVCQADPSATQGWFPVKGWVVGNVLLIAESESSATGGLDYQIHAKKEGSEDVQIIAGGNIAQATIAAGGVPGTATASVALGAFELDTYGWEALRLVVKASAGSVVYSAYFVGKN